MLSLGTHSCMGNHTNDIRSAKNAESNVDPCFTVLLSCYGGGCRWMFWMSLDVLDVVGCRWMESWIHGIPYGGNHLRNTLWGHDIWHPLWGGGLRNTLWEHDKEHPSSLSVLCMGEGTSENSSALTYCGSHRAPKLQV